MHSINLTIKIITTICVSFLKMLQMLVKQTQLKFPEKSMISKLSKTWLISILLSLIPRGLVSVWLNEETIKMVA